MSFPNLRALTCSVAVFLAALILNGCAGTRMQMPQLSPVTRADMKVRFSEGLQPSLGVPIPQRSSFARQVADRVHLGARVMCGRLFGPEHQCDTRLATYRLTVAASDATVNAQIDSRGQITVFGGLIGRVGSEDELAAVLAHEYAHGLMGHVGKKMRNIATATLIGLAAGAVVGAKSDAPNDTGDAAEAGARIGMIAGTRAYSQAMENEADHLGLFILREAGFNLKAASHFHMRLLNERKFVQTGRDRHSLLYLRTHPGSKERIQKLIAAEKMIESGHTQPLWKR